MNGIALTIAGSDSSGGAGLQADLKTFSALGVYGASVVTALTAQNTQGVFGVHDVPPYFVRAQMDAVFSDLDVRVVKIGMLSHVAIIQAVAEGLRRWKPAFVVLDPVMVAASGGQLLRADAVQVLQDELFPLVQLITPNLPEAAVLLGSAVALDEDAQRVQAEALFARAGCPVLLKGGHGQGELSVDVLRDGDGLHRFAAPRLASRHTHGTGCTLASAVAAFVARGLPLRDAVEQAKAYVTAAIAAADGLSVGKGCGPVWHFFERDARV